MWPCNGGEAPMEYYGGLGVSLKQTSICVRAEELIEDCPDLVIVILEFYDDEEGRLEPELYPEARAKSF